MNITVRHTTFGSHVHMRLFLDGSNIGTLTMTIEEFEVWSAGGASFTFTEE